MGTPKRDILNENFGKLTVVRHLPDDMEFCTCACGSHRTVHRRQLTGKAIEACHKCAAANRKTAYMKRREPQPEVIIPEPVAICTGRIENGFLLCSPDCPRHRLAGAWPRQLRPVIPVEL